MEGFDAVMGSVFKEEPMMAQTTKRWCGFV